MVSLDDFPTLNEVLEENQKTRDRSPTIKFLEKFSQFSVEKGNKGKQKEYDYVLKYHGHKVTLLELFSEHTYNMLAQFSCNLSEPSPFFKSCKIFS